MAQNANSVNDRLQQASQGGSPQLDPDQQRRYLGTFRERVSLVIPVQDASKNGAQQALVKDMTKHPDYDLSINSAQLGTSVAIQYAVLANKHNIKYTDDNDSNYANPKFSYAVVFNHPSQPIDQNPILWNKKYPPQKPTSNQKASHTQKSSVWQKIKNWF